jgi:carbonic anhydrase/acetyltransferase-like protein (isoleucine patch superfamily)
MTLIRSVRGKSPKWGEDCFFAENATIIGEVTMGNKCTVWYQAVVRGDVHFIQIGDMVNIQDGAVIHCTYEQSPTIIGNKVSIGHNALIHACTIHDRVLIGMGAIIMDDVVIPEGTMVAAGALVPPRKVLESGFIYSGSPARKHRVLTEEDISFFIDRTAENYSKYADWFRAPKTE